MIKSTSAFVFRNVYEMAALVEACVEKEESLIEIDWTAPEVQLGLVRFSKISLLHRYICQMIAVEHDREYRKNADLYETERIAELEAVLDAYEIAYQSYVDFVPPIAADQAASRAQDPFYQWFLSQETAFDDLWEKLTDETFHLLFANRSFLLKFNRAVALYLRHHPEIVSGDCLDADRANQAAACAGLGS